MEHLEEIFAQFNKKVEEESLIRDEIKKHVKEIELGARAAQAALQHLHTDVTKGDNRAKWVCSSCSQRDMQQGAGYHSNNWTTFCGDSTGGSPGGILQISRLVEVWYGDPFSTYSAIWNSYPVVVSQLVTILSLITWLETGGLITLKQVEEALNSKQYRRRTTT